MATAFALLAVPCRAGGYEVRPLFVETQDGFGAVTVTNTAPQPLYIEAAIYSWSKSPDGEDRYAPDPDAIVSPPGTWIEPQQAYRLRLRVHLPPSGHEAAWRVVITQVPSHADLLTGNVVFAISQNVPVFASTGPLRGPSIAARLEAPRRLVLSNDGDRRLKVWRVVQDGQVLVPGLAGYVLPGARLPVVLKSPAHAGRIEFETDLGSRTVVVD
jgi:P pilus assembly chaperone PapD